MFDELLTAVAAARTPGTGVRACARLENAACSARLGYMADMLDAAFSASGSAHREQWRCDNWGAVCAQIGAAHSVTSGVVNNLLMDAVTLRERIPKVAEVFAEGLIAYRLVRLICQRSMLVKVGPALQGVDAELARQLRTWGARSVDQAQRDVDALVLRYDPYAVRRTESSSRNAHVDVATEPATGVSYVTATVSAPDGEAFDRRLDELARTVCARDPRDLDQRRAAAVGALGFGWDRLPCLCEHDDCDAATKPSAGGVVIHVVVRHDAYDAYDGSHAPEEPRDSEEPRDTEGPRDAAAVLDSGPAPGPRPQPEPEPEPETGCASGESSTRSELAPTTTGDLTALRRALVGKNPPLLPQPWYTYTLSGLIAALNNDPGQLCQASPAALLGGAILPAPVAAQAAMYATIREVIHPGQAPPEPHYRPSRKLAEFIRCRDQTCRFPGCTRPATVTDIDHTIPYPCGPTCASNLACLCREHHLLKTFWPGWSNRQFPDGSIIWTDPEGTTTTTYPGSRLLFPELSAATAPVNPTGTPPPKHTAGLTMPKRAIARAEVRRQRITDERRYNGEAE